MTFQTIIRSVSMLAAFALLPSAFAATVSVRQLETEKEGLQLIRQVEEVARDVRYNAGRLNAFNSTLLISKWTHIHHLDQIRSLVNDGLRPSLDRLTEIGPQLPAWKQASIGRMLESAKALAADADSAILSKYEARGVPPALNTEYKTLIARIYGHSENLVKTSDAAGTYSAARMKAAQAGVPVPQH